MSQSNKLKIDTEKFRKYKSKTVSRIPLPLCPSLQLQTNRWKQAGVQTVFRSDDLQKYFNALSSCAGEHMKPVLGKDRPCLTTKPDLHNEARGNFFENKKELSQLHLILKSLRPVMKDASVSASISSMPNKLHASDSIAAEGTTIEKYETDIQKLSTTNGLLQLELTLLTDFINLGYEALNLKNIVGIPADGKIPTSFKLREIVLSCVQYCKSHGKRLQELKEMEQKYDVVQKFLATSKVKQVLEDGVQLDQIESDLNLSILRDNGGNNIKCDTKDVGTESFITYESMSNITLRRKKNITEDSSDLPNGSEEIDALPNDWTEYGRLKRHVVLVKALVEEQEAMVEELSGLAKELSEGITI